jgi:hypothetical protein
MVLFGNLIYIILLIFSFILFFSLIAIAFICLIAICLLNVFLLKHLDGSLVLHTLKPLLIFKKNKAYIIYHIKIWETY